MSQVADKFTLDDLSKMKSWWESHTVEGQSRIPVVSPAFTKWCSKRVCSEYPHKRSVCADCFDRWSLECHK